MTQTEMMTVVKGSRVTPELKTWFDGAPVVNWPSPHYLGTVVELVDLYKIGKITHVKVKFDSGRKELENLDRLEIVKPIS